MAKFDIEFDKLILVEGGYVNDPADSGGETYLGISRKHNPDWKGWKLIDAVKAKFGTKGITARLKKEKSITDSAKALYKERYWDVLYLDDVPSQLIAHQLFDTCVNCGKATAIRIAQEVLGLPADGRWSCALKEALSKYGKK